MSRRPPLNGTPYKKGQSGNPKGSSAKRRNEAALKRLQPMLAEAAPGMTIENVRLIIGGLLMGSTNDIKAAEEEQQGNLMVLYRMLSNCVAACSRKGDVQGLLRLFEFVLGKAPEKVEVTGKDGAPLAVREQSMSVEQMQAELDAIRKRKAAQGLT